MIACGSTSCHLMVFLEELPATQESLSLTSFRETQSQEFQVGAFSNSQHCFSQIEEIEMLEAMLILYNESNVLIADCQGGD